VLYAVLKALIRALLRLLFRFRAIGVGQVPPAGAVMLAANHVSLLDPPAIGAAAPRPLHYMAKAELFRVPLLGRLIGSLNAHPVERDGADATALRHALLLLRRGEALLVFPEGTRGAEGGPLGPGRAGAGMLAALSEAPVVPVYIEGTGRVLPRGATRPRWAPITVRYGRPLTFGRGERGERGRSKQRYQEISDQIMAAIGRLRAEAEQASSGSGGARDPRDAGEPRAERRPEVAPTAPAANVNR
jgi:1-acyl-sn-glycerol-3-phosphate acyltransferase